MTGLSRTRDFLELLQKSLEPEPGEERNPFLDSVGVNYLLTVVYSDLERAIKSALTAYLSVNDNHRGNAFAQKAVGRTVRSIKVSDVAGVLGWFDADCKKHFQDLIGNSKAQLAYDRIIAGRHDQAHSLGSGMTISDFEADLEHCQAVLDAISDALQCDCEH